MKENMLVIINNVLAYIWPITIVGLIHIMILEAKILFKALKQKKIKLLAPIAKRVMYPVLGLFLIFFSFLIVNSIIDIITPASMAEPNYDNLETKDFWTTWKYQTQYAGVISVVGFLIAGISLILSAGGRWLVNLAKLFVTLTVLYLFFSVFVAYA